MIPLRLKLHAAITRLKSHPRFTSIALKFWPTRRIAQQQASELFDVVSGFVYSQILYSAVKLDLFDTLKKPSTVAVISQKTGLTATATHRLLRATTAMKLTCALPAEHYGLGKLGTALVNNPGLTQLIEHHEMFYRDLADPISLLSPLGAAQPGQSTQLRNYWAYAKNTDPTVADTSQTEEVQAYSALMAASQPMVSEQVLQCYPLDQHRKLLDLGGGTGRFLTNVRHQYPELELALFDLNSVRSANEQTLLNQQRIEQHSGDFFQDPLPEGADIISLVRILHDHNDDAVATLLSRIFELLPNNGTVLIAEPLADTRGALRMGDAYFNFYFLAMGKGEPRSAKRLNALLQNAGFTNVSHHRTTLPLVCSVISATAVKPG